MDQYVMSVGGKGRTADAGVDDLPDHRQEDDRLELSNQHSQSGCFMDGYFAEVIVVCSTRRRYRTGTDVWASRTACVFQDLEQIW